MKISFSQGKRSPWSEGRWLNSVSFGLVALWPHTTPWAGWLAWGASLWSDPGSGCKHSLWGWITVPPPSSSLEIDLVICNPFWGAAL